MRTRPIILSLLAAGALTISACGGDGGSSGSSDNPYAEPIASSLASSPDTPLDGDQTDCLGAGFADAIGVERFEAAGVEPADVESSTLGDLELEFTSDDAGAFAAVLDDCDIDMKQLLVDQLGSNDAVPTELVTCIEDNVDENRLRDVFAAGMAGDEMQDDSALFEVLGPCLEIDGS